MGFSGSGGAPGHWYMADKEFAWLESGQDEEWLLIELGDQNYIISFLQFAQLVNPGRETGNENQWISLRLRPYATRELRSSWRCSF